MKIIITTSIHSIVTFNFSTSSQDQRWPQPDLWGHDQHGPVKRRREGKILQIYILKRGHFRVANIANVPNIIWTTWKDVPTLKAICPRCTGTASELINMSWDWLSILWNADCRISVTDLIWQNNVLMSAKKTNKMHKTDSGKLCDK